MKLGGEAVAGSPPIQSEEVILIDYCQAWTEAFRAFLTAGASVASKSVWVTDHMLDRKSVV